MRKHTEQTALNPGSDPLKSPCRAVDNQLYFYFRRAYWNDWPFANPRGTAAVFNLRSNGSIIDQPLLQCNCKKARQSTTQHQIDERIQHWAVQLAEQVTDDNL